jgi:hypothetical protein
MDCSKVRFQPVSSLTPEDAPATCRLHYIQFKFYGVRIVRSVNFGQINLVGLGKLDRTLQKLLSIFDRVSRQLGIPGITQKPFSNDGTAITQELTSKSIGVHIAAKNAIRVTRKTITWRHESQHPISSHAGYKFLHAQRLVGSFLSLLPGPCGCLRIHPHSGCLQCVERRFSDLSKATSFGFTIPTPLLGEKLSPQRLELGFKAGLALGPGFQSSPI